MVCILRITFREIRLNSTRYLQVTSEACPIASIQRGQNMEGVAGQHETNALLAC